MTIQYRREIIEALDGSGLIGNEKQFWNTLLTSLGYAGPAVATETAFWRAFVTAIGGYSPALPDDQAVVEDGDTVALGGTTVTLDVSGNALTSASIPGTFGVVEDGDTLPVTGGTVTISVTGNTVSAEYTPD